MLNIKSDPLSDIVAFIKSRNPLFAPSDKNVVIPRAVNKVIDPAANTELDVMMNPIYGYNGSMKIRFNRMDLSKALNQFGTVSKIPTVKIFGVYGESKTIFGYISQINNALGITLANTGDYRDIDDGSFLVPAKNSKVDINVVPNANTSIPFSLQILPGTPFKLSMLNMGFLVSSAAVTRSINPIVKSNATINWKLTTSSPIATPLKNKAIQMFNDDFTELFTMYPPASMVTATAGASNSVNFTLQAAFKTALNARLSAIGVPLVNTFVYNVHWSVADTPDKYWSQRVKYTAGLTDPRVNHNYNSVFIMEAAYQTVSGGWDTTEYYLHFNR